MFETTRMPESILTEQSVLVVEVPRRRYSLRYWLAAVAIGLSIGLLDKLSWPFMVVGLFSLAGLAIVGYYRSVLSRVSVQDVGVRILRNGCEVMYPLSQVVLLERHSEQVRLALADGRWLALSWPIYMRKRARLAKALRLFDAIDSVCDVNVGATKRSVAVASAGEGTPS